MQVRMNDLVLLNVFFSFFSTLQKAFSFFFWDFLSESKMNGESSKKDSSTPPKTNFFSFLVSYAKNSNVLTKRMLSYLNFFFLNPLWERRQSQLYTTVIFWEGVQTTS